MKPTQRSHNIYHVSLEDLVRNVFVLLDEAWRTKLLIDIGVELDSRGAPLAAREDWRDLLESAQIAGKRVAVGSEADETSGTKILIVTDPMCSWCWGMTREVDRARALMPEAFDVLLGGINVHGTQPIGAFGRDHLMGIWREVQATTGQTFGFELPTPLIYNSTLPCIAVQAVREALGVAPFDYLHRLQERFFVEGVNINDLETLAATASECGVDREVFLQAAGSEKVRAAVRFQMSTSRDFGTNALPSVLGERDGERRLLAGGYLNAEALLELARQFARP